MANYFKVTYQIFTTDPDLPTNDEGAPKTWQASDTELMPEAKCTVVFQRLRARALATSQQQIRLVRMWESDMPIPTFTDVSATHIQTP